MHPNGLVHQAGTACVGWYSGFKHALRGTGVPAGFMFAESVERQWVSLKDTYICQPYFEKESYPGILLRRARARACAASLLQCTVQAAAAPMVWTRFQHLQLQLCMHVCTSASAVTAPDPAPRHPTLRLG